MALLLVKGRGPSSVFGLSRLGCWCVWWGANVAFKLTNVISEVGFSLCVGVIK